MRWLPIKTLFERAWSGEKKSRFHFIEEADLNAYLLNKKFDNRKRYQKFKLNAISALLATGGTDIAAPNATDRFSGTHFPRTCTSHPDNTASPEDRQKEKGDQIPMWGFSCKARTLCCAMLCNMPHRSSIEVTELFSLRQAWNWGHISFMITFEYCLSSNYRLKMEVKEP